MRWFRLGVGVGCFAWSICGNMKTANAYFVGDAAKIFLADKMQPD